MYLIIGGDGKQYGPITDADMRKWVAEGRLNAQSLVKAESDAEFRTLSTFPEFADVFAMPAPLPGSPPLLGVSQGDRRAALDKVKVPAIGLMVSSALSFIMSVWGLISFGQLWIFGCGEAKIRCHLLANEQPATSAIRRFFHQILFRTVWHRQSFVSNSDRRLDFRGRA
jgi:hypothetical protein